MVFAGFEPEIFLADPQNHFQLKEQDNQCFNYFLLLTFTLKCYSPGWGPTPSDIPSFSFLSVEGHDESQEQYKPPVVQTA